MKLVAQSGPLAGQEVPIDKAVLVLGRGAECDILMQDHEVSRRHAEVHFVGGQVSIADAGSMNGTFVNGMRIQGMQALLPGDQIRVGATVFLLQEGVALAPAAAVDSDLGMGGGPPPPPVAGGGSSRLGLVLAAAVALVILAIAALVAFLALRSKGGPATAGGGAVTPTAGQAAPSGTSAPAQGTPAPPSGATPTPLVQLFVTFTPKPGVPTVAASPATGGGAPSQPMSTPQSPPFTVKWSPGRYEGWAEGKRMSSDLTISNVALAEISPPYTPYFIVSDPKGQMRQADLKDYGEGKGPPPIAKGQTITWTWFGVMDKNEWVRGSVFRYAGYAWAQEFNPDGSLAGSPRVIDEKQLIPFLPKEVPPEMLPTLAATMAAGGMPTGIPTGVPSGVPTGIPTAKP
jgi:Inner membrane component of T3SS, cytoplasmic domain